MLPRSAGTCCASRFADDQTFSALQATDLETMDVVDGTWYVYLKGDYAGRVSGAVYDLRNSSDPVKLVTTVSPCYCCNTSSEFSLATLAQMFEIERA